MNEFKIDQKELDSGQVTLSTASGERVTLALQPSDVHDPTELPTYLAGYKPFGYRADEISPPILVDNDSDKYRNFNSADAFRPVSVKAGSSGAIPEVDPTSTLNTYKVVDRVIGSFIPQQTESQTGNNYQPRLAAARRCARAVELDRENDVMTLVETAGSWDSSVQTAALNPWSDTSSGTPIVDVSTAIEKSAQPVTGIWMNQHSAFEFLRHPDVRTHMAQMLGDNAPQQAVTQVFAAGATNVDFTIPGFPPFHVAASKIQNSAGALVYTLGDVCVLVTAPPGVPTDGEEIASTYSFRRRGPSGTGFETREFRVENRGPLGGTMVVVSMADIAVMTGNNAGGIITAI